MVGMALALDGSKAGRVLERRRSERVDSVLDDPEIDHRATRRLGVRAALYVPLVARGRPIGVVIAHDRVDTGPAFTDDDLRLAETLAQRAAVAVDLGAGRPGRDAPGGGGAGTEPPARAELHDETGQALTSILLGLKGVEQETATEEARAALASVRDTVATTLQGVRRLAVELRRRPSTFGLVPALERLAATFGEQTGLQVDFEASIDDERFSPEVETTLYRIVQEALTNVVKHAAATRVSILVVRRGDSVAAVVEDDGRGTSNSSTTRGSASWACANARRSWGAGYGSSRRRGRDDDRGRGAGPMTIRVLVVDDHAVVRAGLRRILDAEPDIEAVAEAPNGERAVFEAMEHRPDVVLMDVVMPGKSGIEATRAVLQAVPSTTVLVLSMQDDPRYVREAFEAGRAAT